MTCSSVHVFKVKFEGCTYIIMTVWVKDLATVMVKKPTPQCCPLTKKAAQCGRKPTVNSCLFSQQVLSHQHFLKSVHTLDLY